MFLQAMSTEIALYRHAFRWFLESGIFKRGLLVRKENPVVIDTGTGIVRASLDTGLTAYAQIPVDVNYTVLAGIGGSGGTDFHANRLLTMIAKHR
jgi:hypothetical protein